MNSSPIACRPLTGTDAAALLAFYQARPPWITHWFDPFPDPDRVKIDQHLDFVLTADAISLGLFDGEGRVVGHGFILVTRSPAPVFGIGLAEALVGRGYGCPLLQAVLAVADQQHLPLVTLTVFKDNLRAKRLYEQAGFVVSGEATCRTPHDSWAMQRKNG